MMRPLPDGCSYKHESRGQRKRSRIRPNITFSQNLLLIVSGMRSGPPPANRGSPQNNRRISNVIILLSLRPRRARKPSERTERRNIISHPNGCSMYVTPSHNPKFGSSHPCASTGGCLEFGLRSVRLSLKLGPDFSILNTFLLRFLYLRTCFSLYSFSYTGCQNFCCQSVAT